MLPTGAEDTVSEQFTHYCTSCIHLNNWDVN